jgi:RimJ/RimL family protein N-acetyltransferase
MSSGPLRSASQQTRPHASTLTSSIGERHHPPWRNPSREVLQGRTVRLEKLDWSKHGAAAFEAVGNSAEVWHYMPRGPFPDAETMRISMAACAASVTDPFVIYAVVRQSDDKVIGLAAYLRMRANHGSVEVGQLAFCPVELQRTRASTEVQLLMMEYVFNDLHYRRYEWKCDRLNARSMSAATRLGFTFEGVFRQDMWNKGRNRDTAWFSIIDSEWPLVEKALRAYFADDNFDAAGLQIRSLATIRATLIEQAQSASAAPAASDDNATETQP